MINKDDIKVMRIKISGVQRYDNLGNKFSVNRNFSEIGYVE
jgi:hypothetical protein